MSAPALAVRISASLGELRAAVAGGRAEFASLADAARSASAKASASFRTLRNEFKTGFLSQLGKQGRDDKGRFLPITKRDTDELRGSVNQLGGAFRGLVAPISAIGAAWAAIRLSDDLTNIQARLKLATTSTQAASAAFTALFDTAQSRGGSLRDLADLYIRLGLATKDAGTSQGALLKVTEAVADAVLVSGGNVETANAALVQFAQGLASNRLSGDELRSILEQLPPLADAIAKGMGVTRGELRKLGEEGKLTTEKVLTAVLNQGEALKAQAQSIPVTFGRAFQKLKNAALTLVEPFQESFATISQAISDFADFLSSDAVLGAVTAFVTEIKLVYQDFASGISQTFDSAGSVLSDFVTDFGKAFHGFFELLGSTVSYDQFVANSKKMVRDVVEGFKNLPANITAFLKIVTLEFIGMFDKVLIYAKFFAEAVKAVFTDDTIDAAQKRRDAALQASNNNVRTGIELALQQRDIQIENAALARQVAEEERRGQRAYAEFQKKNIKTGGGKPAPRTAAQIAAELALRKAAIEADEKLADDARKRSLSQLEVFHDRKLITEEQFIDARTALELQGLDAQQRIEERRLGLGGKEAIEARAALEIIERQRSDVVRKGEEDRNKIRKGFAEQNLGLQADLLEATGREDEAALLRIKTDFDKLIADLVAAGNFGGAEIAKALFKAQTFKTEFDSVRTEFEKLLASLDAREASLANQQIAGGISPDLAESQLRETRARTLEQMSVKVAKLKELAAAEGATAEQIRAAADAEIAYQQKVIDSATGLDKAIFDLRASLKNLRANFASAAADAAVQSFAGLLESLGDSTTSLKDKLKEFVRGFAQSMAAIAARALATYAVLSLLEAVFPGAGKLVAAGGGVASSVTSHKGGIVGKATARRRNVSPLVFAGAPRYHGGGIAGIAPNEQATILQKGEEVITAGDPRHANNGGRGGSVRVVNMIDQGNVHNAMASAGGEKVILNAIRANAGGVRQLLSQG